MTNLPNISSFVLISKTQVNGKMTLNDAYTRWQNQQGGAAVGQTPTTLRNPQQALAIVSTQEDMAAQNAAAVKAGKPEYELSSSTIQTFTELQGDDVGRKIGVPTDEVLDRLEKVLAKYEIPVGLVAKLLELKRFNTLYFIIDDSSSMKRRSDSHHPDGHQMTRWEEAFMRIKTLLEIISYVPIQKVRVAFLNRRETIDVVRQGDTPQQFLGNVGQQLDRFYFSGPLRGTPAYGALQQAMNFPGSKSVYFFGDGEPNRGERPLIETLIVGRRNSYDSPVTFMSCTNEDDQVEWFVV